MSATAVTITISALYLNDKNEYDKIYITLIPQYYYKSNFLST